MNTRYLWIFLIILIVACGQAPNDTTSNAVAPETVSQPEKAKTQDVGSAMLVNSREAFPLCGEDNEGQLVYSIADVKFYVCSSFYWAEIDLHGVDGKNGVNGTNGVNGVNGIDGKNGTNGKDGKTLAPVDEYSWYHPVTNVKWFLGRTLSSLYNPAVYPNLMTPDYTCPAGSRLPTDAEYNDALGAGLWAKFGSKQPLLVDIGTVNYTQGILSYYSFRSGKPAQGAIGQLFSGSSFGTATALCLVE